MPNEKITVEEIARRLGWDGQSTYAENKSAGVLVAIPNVHGDVIEAFVYQVGYSRTRKTFFLGYELWRNYYGWPVDCFADPVYVGDDPRAWRGNFAFCWVR